ncbi:MAG: BatD family protein [bacterium]
MTHFPIKHSILAALIVGVGVPALLGQGLELSAHVDRTPVSLNQQFELTVELSGSDANKAPEPAVPDIEEFASYLGSGSSQNIQIINGRMSVSKTISYHFIATKVGKFQIPPIEIRYRGKRFATDAIPIEIVQGQAAAPQTQGRRQNRAAPKATGDLSDVLFLRATANKKRVYQNEPIVVSYKIYMAVTVTTYGISQLPNTVGFWNEEIPLPQRPGLHEELVNGRRFRVAEIKKLVLFPQGPGMKTLDPLTIECEVQMKRRRRRNDLFDSFFEDPFFGLTQTVRRNVTSNPLSIEVMPLPENGKPDDFSGAVGIFSISNAVDKTEVKTNEAVTLKVNISGTGNIKFLPKPHISFPTDFEVYDPKISENINRKNNVISGSKTFEYILIPRFPGNQVIKPISFSYFDLNKNKYKTVRTNPVTISVSKGNEQLVSVGIGSSKEDVKFIGKDIRFIQMRLPEFHKIGRVFYKEWPFFAILIVPLLLLGATVGYQKHLEKLNTNVAYARSRKANQMALKRLRLANKQLKQSNASAFYGEVSKALMGFIGDKFNVFAAGLMTDQVEAMLRQRGAREEVATEFLECLKDCEYRRFAPSAADNGALQDFFERSKNAIISLEREI